MGQSETASRPKAMKGLSAPKIKGKLSLRASIAGEIDQHPGVLVRRP
jgi:hypothetical protein